MRQGRNHKRILKEFRMFSDHKNNPHIDLPGPNCPYFDAAKWNVNFYDADSPAPQDPLWWRVALHPETGPYAGGVICTNISFPPTYPFKEVNFDGQVIYSGMIVPFEEAKEWDEIELTPEDYVPLDKEDAGRFIGTIIKKSEGNVQVKYKDGHVSNESRSWWESGADPVHHQKGKSDARFFHPIVDKKGKFRLHTHDMWSPAFTYKWYLQALQLVFERVDILQQDPEFWCGCYVSGELCFNIQPDVKKFIESHGNDEWLKRSKELFVEPELYQNMFLRIIDDNEKTSWNRSRIMLVGQGSAGKSSCVRSILGLPFNPKWDSTVGADVTEAEVNQPVSSKSKGQLSRWKKSQYVDDHLSRFVGRIMQNQNLKATLKSQVSSDDPGINMEFESSSRSSALTENNDSKGFEEVLPSSFEFAEMNQEEASLKGTVSSDHHNIGVDEAVTEAEVKKSKLAKNRSDISPSARKIFSEHTLREYSYSLADEKTESLSLSFWDFGGQKVFYSMHHIFLTKSGVYVLVFDMREMLNSSTRDLATEHLLFWLRSAKLHAPNAPLIMVGSFLDQVKEKSDIETINSILKVIMKDIFRQVVPNKNSNLVYFPVDNRNGGESVSELRLVLEKIIKEDEFVNSQIPVRWMLLLDKILTAKSGGPFIKLPEVENMGKEAGIASVEEIEEALHLFHQRGMIIHLTATAALKNKIIIKPQWLVDGLSKVIRDESIHTYDLQEIDKLELKQDLNMLLEKALVSRDFLEYLWKGKDVEFFIDLMRRTLLLSEWNFEKETHYLIPSLLRNTWKDYKKLADKDFRASTNVFKLSFVKDFLPVGVFQRLTCLCVARRSRLSEPVLYQNFASMEFEPECNISLFEDSKSQSILVFVEGENFASTCVSVISSMLEKLNYDVMGSGLKWEILLQDSKKENFVLDAEARRLKLKPWYSESEIGGTERKTESCNVDLDSFLSCL